MKTLNRLVLLLSFCFFAFSATAQNFDLEYIFSENQENHVLATLPVGDAIYSVGSIRSCYTPTLHKSSTMEQKLWQGPGGYWRFTDLDMTATAEPLLVTCGYHRSFDDVGTPDDGPRVVGYNLTGGQVFQTELPKLHNAEVDESMQLCIDGAGQIVVKSGSELFWLSPNGTLAQMRSFLGVEFVDLSPLDGSTLLALGKDRLYWLDNNGEKLDSLSMNAPARDLWVGGNQAYVLTASEFLVINSPTNVQAYDLLQNEMHVEGITGNANVLLFWGGDHLTAYSRIIEVDRSSLTITDNVLFEQDGATVRDLNISNNEVIVSGTATDPMTRLDYGFIKTIDLLSPPVFTDHKIAINEFRTNNQLDVTTEEIQVGVDSFATLYTYDAFPLKFEFDITNEGSETIESFTLHSSSMGAINCRDRRIFIEYNNLALEPGMSMTIVDSAAVSFGTSLDPEPELRVSVFSPNHYFDTDLIDNTEAVDFRVGIIAPFPPIDPNHLRLMPNPAQDVLFVKLSEWKDAITDAELSVFDSRGQRLIYQADNNFLPGDKTMLEISHLPNGIYFLSIKNDKQWAMKKFVVSR